MDQNGGKSVPDAHECRGASRKGDWAQEEGDNRLDKIRKQKGKGGEQTKGTEKRRPYFLQKAHRDGNLQP